MSKDFALIITAAGRSERFNNGKDGEKKEYLGSEGVWIGTPLTRNNF